MTNEEVYLRVYRDMPFMLEIISRCGEQADSFACEMLSKRILLERHAVHVEEDRAVRERAEEMIVVEEKKLITGND